MFVNCISEYSERDKGEPETRTGAQSPLDEEGLDIPSGSVKRQLQNIEKTYKKIVTEPARPADLTDKPVSTPHPEPAVAKVTHSSSTKLTLSTSKMSSPVASPYAVTSPGKDSVAVSPVTSKPENSQTTKSLVSSTSHTVMSSSASPTKVSTTDKSNSQSASVVVSGCAAKNPPCKSVSKTELPVSTLVEKPVKIASNVFILESKPESPEKKDKLCSEKSGSGSTNQKEELPWNVGTVKQQKAAIEGKLHEGTGSRRESQELPVSSPQHVALPTTSQAPAHLLTNSPKTAQLPTSLSKTTQPQIVHQPTSSQNTAPQKTQTVATGEKLILSRPNQEEKPEEKQRCLKIIEKNTSSSVSPKVAMRRESKSQSHALNVKEPQTEVKVEGQKSESKRHSDFERSRRKSSPISRSQSLKEKECKVVTRPRSNTDTSPTAQPTNTLPLQAYASSSSPECKTADTSQDDCDSDSSGKSDSQSVRDLRGFFENKDASTGSTIDRTKRPSSLHGTEGSTSGQHRKATMTRSLDSSTAEPALKESEASESRPESSQTRSPKVGTLENVQEGVVSESAGHVSPEKQHPSCPASPLISHEPGVRVRRQHGKSHPLTRLAQDSRNTHSGQRTKNPIYNTM